MIRDQQVDEYRALLRAPWDEAALDRSLTLLRSFDAFQKAQNQPLRFGIGDVLVGVDESSPPLARDVVWGLVAAEQSGDQLIRDTVSLVASQAVEELGDSGSMALADALTFVAKFLFDDQPARRHSLEAEIHAALGRAQLALAAWRAALATTEVDAHDYLTRVQTLWFAYIDQGRDEEAAALISSLPAGLREQFHAEIEEGLATAPGADDSDLVRIQAGLSFGDDDRREEGSKRNVPGPTGETGTIPSGDACTT